MRTILLALALAAAVPLAAQAKPEKDTTKFAGSKAYCYFNQKILTWRIGNDAVEGTVHFDRDRDGLFLEQVRGFAAGDRITPVGLRGQQTDEFSLQPDRNFSLQKGWEYSWQSVATTASQGRLLTIHLQGVGVNRGLELEAYYQVWPGNRPYLASWHTLINRTGNDLTLAPNARQMAFTWTPGRRGTLPGEVNTRSEGKSPSGYITMYDATTRHGILVAASPAKGPGASTGAFTGTQNRFVVSQTPSSAVTLSGKGGRYTETPVVFEFYRGDPAAGQALWARFPDMTQTAVNYLPAIR